MDAFTPTSELRCPHCSHAELLAMPTDACVILHRCSGCGALLRPKAGDCCVFCSHGTVPCPPVQLGGRVSSCNRCPWTWPALSRPARSGPSVFRRAGAS